MKKCALIYSGGLDSTTLLYWLRNKGYEVYALTFNYGQRHNKEVEFAKRLCEEEGVPHTIVDISSIKPIMSSSALTGVHEIPEAPYSEDTLRITVCPNRNAILLNLAIAFAITNKIPSVAYAAHASDGPTYPDTRPEFVEKMQELAKVVHFEPIEVLAPFLHMTKADIVKIGLELGVDYSKCWSCYKGLERPCGKCPTCIQRTEAFLKNGVKDLLLTDEEWNRAVEYVQMSQAKEE